MTFTILLIKRNKEKIRIILSSTKTFNDAVVEAYSNLTTDGYKSVIIYEDKFKLMKMEKFNFKFDELNIMRNK